MESLRRGGLGGQLAKLATAMGLGGSALIAPQVGLVLVAGLIGLGLMVVWALVLILFCEDASRRLRELVRELRRG